MSLLSATLRRVAVLVAAQSSADHLLSKDDAGTTRISRWFSTVRGLGVRTCPMCGTNVLSAEAGTCQEHNMLYAGIVGLTHDLGLPDTEVYYLRRRHARGAQQMIQTLAQVMDGPGLISPTACPSINAPTDLPVRTTFVPTQVFIGADTGSRSRFMRPDEALKRGLVTAILVPGLDPITTAGDYRRIVGWSTDAR